MKPVKKKKCKPTNKKLIIKDTNHRILTLAFWYLLSILFKNTIFSTHFFLRVVITSLIALSPFDSPFSPPGHLYLLPPPSLLYLILRISLGVLGCWENTSVQFSCSVLSDSLQPHELQHARPPCPSPTPKVHPNPCPLSQWCHSTISSSVIPFSSLGNWLLARLVSPLLTPPLLCLVTSITLLPLLFSM